MLQKLPLHEHDEGGREMFVRDEAGNAAQADVIVYQKQKPLSWQMQWAQNYSPYHFVALAASQNAGAKRYRSNEDGVVRIAKGDNLQCFGISDDGLSRSIRLDGFTVITMRPHRRVILEAIDAQGRPAANLPVAINDDVTQRRAAGAITNAIGRGTIYVPWTTHETPPTLSIRPLLIGATPIAIAIADDYFDGLPRLLRIKLPQVGSVRIQLAASVRTSDKPPNVSLSALTDAGSLASTGSQTIEFGEMVVPYVALNQQVHVFVIAANNHSQRASGPTKPGEQVTITVHGEPVTMTGRLLDKDGQPIADRNAFALVAMRNGQHASKLRTDQSGRFSVDLHIAYMRAGRARVQIDCIETRTASPIGLFMGETTNSREPRAARIVAWPTAGRVDLGDLTMQLAPELLHGTVVDLDGRPVAGLTVQAKTGWAEPSKYRATTAVDGSFAFYEEAPKAREKASIYIRVTSKHWRMAHGAEAAIGDAADLQVRPICSARFQLDNAQLSSMLRAYLVGKSGDRHAGYPDAGACRFRGLPPGKYSLQLELAGGLVKRIDDLELVHRLANAPAGEAAINWLDEMPRTKLQIRSPDGMPIDAKGAIASGEQQSKFVHSRPTGELQLPYIDGQELLIQAPTFRSQRIKPTSDATTVVMQPRADLRISTPAGLALPRETWVRFDGSSEQQQLRPAGPTTVRPDASGETYLTLIVADGRGGFDEVHSQVVKLPKHAQPLAVMLQVDAEIVANANQIAAAGRAKLAARMRR
jgi:hypothetical protein